MTPSRRCYERVQRAVDRLSEDGFPVENLDVVGSDLRLVERVTGRLTKARAAGAGAVSGLWAGLLIGLLLALFTSGHSVFAVVAVGAALGAAWGALFGYPPTRRPEVGATSARCGRWRRAATTSSPAAARCKAPGRR